MRSDKNFMYWKIFILICIISSGLTGCRKTPASNVLATVNQNVVTIDDFSERYGKLLKMASLRDNLLARQKVLNGLVTEEMLLVKAHSLGLTSDQDYKNNVDAIEQQSLLTAYAEYVARKRVKVEDKDVRQAFVRLKTQVNARHLYAESRQEAQELYDRLIDGESFKRLAREVFNDPALRSNGGALGYFTLGDMDPAFEDAAFNLKIGEISQPVKTAYGYSVIQVLDKIRNPFITEHEYQRKKGKINAYIEWLKTKEEIKEFTRDAARMLNIEINESAFDYLSNKLLKHDDLLQETPDGIAHARSDEQAKSEALVVFDSKRWTVGDFFDRAEFTSLRQKKRIKDCEQLRLFIKGLVLRDKLIEQARAIGLHKHRSVQKEIAREIRSYTLKRMRDRIEQEMRNKVQVPVSAMRAHYTMFADQYFFLEEANVAEILVDSETLGKEIIARLGRGEAFADLARKYSLREWAKERGGELGFAPRSKFGALADTVFATPIGSVIGPLRIEQHYSVIKILAKKDRKSKNFTQAKEQVEQELGWKWQKEGMQNYLHNLRQEMIVETDEQKLRNVMVPGGTS